MLHAFQYDRIKRTYPVFSMDEAYQIEQRDPYHHWAPALNELLPTYKATLDSKEPFQESLFFEWVEKQHPTLPKTQYFTQEELAPLAVVISNEHRIINAATGRRYEKGMYMFAMTENGEFFLHPKVKPQPGKFGFNHSSFFGGQPLAGVGFFHINEDGVLVGIDNYSGHYKPKTEHVMNVMSALEAQGIDLSKIRYEHRRSPTSVEKDIFPDAKEWYQAQLHNNVRSRLEKTS